MKALLLSIWAPSATEASGKKVRSRVIQSWVQTTALPRAGSGILGPAVRILAGPLFLSRKMEIDGIHLGELL